MPINKQTLTQQIVAELKRRILEGELSTGQRIWAADLVQELDVSMAPVKEALIILQGEGLIKNVPRRGAIVREFSLAEIIDLYEVRFIVESEATRRGMQKGAFDQDRIDILKKLNEKIGKERSGADFKKNSAAYGYDQNFHEVMVETCQNTLLTEWYERLETQSQIIRLMSWNAGPRGDGTYNEHNAIIAGLESGDVDQTVEAIKLHLNSIVAALRKYVLSDEDGQTDYRNLRARRASKL